MKLWLKVFKILLRRKTSLPAGPCIIITFPMIDFLITTISVQFRAFSIDWHVYKMRMNQKVNQMTNSLFTLIHHRPAAPGGPIYFFWQKNWRDWRGGTDSADVLVFVKIIIEIYDFIALNGLLFLCHFIWFVWQLLLSPTFGFTRLQRTKGPVWKRLRENVQVFSFFLGSNSPCVEPVYNLRSCGF